MSRSAANRLILVLFVMVIIMVLSLAGLRLLRLITPATEMVDLPTRVIAVVLPTATSLTSISASTTTPSIEIPVPVEIEPEPTYIKTLTSTRIPTVTAIPTTLNTLNHTVQAGETLLTIAELYNVPTDVIVAANSIINPDFILAGQILRVPVSAPIAQASQPAPQATAVSTVIFPIIQPTWPPSLIGDGVAANYPLTRLTASGQITIHYQPGTYADLQIETLSSAIDATWTYIQAQLGKPFPAAIDVYLAGTLFAINPALQGLTQSGQYRSFILVNGAFHPGEEQYIITHELTHIAATHLLGVASSAMLHEGLAVNLPQVYLTQQAGYLPHTEICAATLGTPEFKTATQMHDFSYSSTGFGGHIRNFFHYNLSGCFVAYLLQTYGLEKFDMVYESGDYVRVYGNSLAELDQEWQSWLTSVPVSVNSQQLINTVNNVALAYQTYLAASSGGVHANWNAYLHLNRARLVANRGQFVQAEVELGLFYAIFAPN